MKKRIITGLIAIPVASVLTMTACSGTGATQETTTETKTEITQESETETATQGQIVGGWTVSSEIVTPVLTERSREAFDKALKDYKGTGLDPAALLATQLVSGTNYLYLCKEEAAAEGTSGWSLVEVYEDLQGNASVSKVEGLEPANIKKAQNAQPDETLGGWKVETVSDAVTLPGEALAAFEKAVEEYGDLTLSPLGLLATQVVSGMNYKILCIGVDADGNAGLYVTTIYADTQGNAQITEIEQMDITQYLK